jgi:hypothetical protein
MKRFLQDNGLSIVLAAIFAVLFVGQSVAGMYQYNGEQQAHGDPSVTYTEYLTTPHFGEAVFENWESEFLQMGAYILLTLFFHQRGSAESNDPDEKVHLAADLAAHRDDPEAPGPVRRGGLQLVLYRYSLAIAFFVLFAGSFVGHALAGLGEYNAQQLAHGEVPTTLAGYVGGSQFWFESLQNWQSEFLAVLAIIILSVWLRADGSPESKRVWEPHRKTGTA